MSVSRFLPMINRRLSWYRPDKYKCRRYNVVAIATNLNGDLEVSAFNGPVFTDCTNEVGKCGCIHAEQRLIICHYEVVKRIQDPILVVNTSPCKTCANLIVESGLFSSCYYNRVYHGNDYRGIDTMKMAAINVIRLTKED